MRIIWSKVSKPTDNKAVFHARYGVVHMEHVNDLEGNSEYKLYTLTSGRKIVLVHVKDNPKGPDQVNARERCMFIAACLDNYLDFERLPVELKESSIVDLSKSPKPQRVNVVEGITINRTYLYHGRRGESYYRVFSVMNATGPDWETLVGYRNIFTGEDWGRALSEFSPDKYRLLAVGDVVPNPSEFKTSI